MKDLNLIELTDLEKRYGKKEALTGIKLNNRERKDHRAFRTQWFWKDNIDQVIKRSVAANIR